MLLRMRGSRSFLLAAAALLLLVVLAARGRSPVPSNLNDDPIEPGVPFVPEPFNNSTPDDEVGILRTWHPGLVTNVLVILVAAMLLLALVLSTIAALRDRVRDRPGVGEVVDRVEGTVDTVSRLRLRDAVEQARDVLARPGGAPRDAVIQAWVILENATTQTRAPHQTATEYTVAVLAEERADEDALLELRSLYHRARFGEHGDETDARRARAALDRILATI